MTLFTMIINKIQDYTFAPDKWFGQLEISSTNSVFLKTFNSKFSYIELWFTDQNSEPLDIEGRTYL